MIKNYKNKSQKQKTAKYGLYYSWNGFKVLPLHGIYVRGNKVVCQCATTNCQSPGKHPVAWLTPNGLKDATSDSTLIKNWFGKFTNHNIGVLTGAASGIIALDIDPRHGGDEALSALERKYQKLPETLWWHTGGGGRHIIFKHPGDHIPNSVGKLGNGLDVRGDGGYIVAPPSRHISGGVYQTSDGANYSIAEAPKWLLNLIKQAAPSAGRLSGAKSGGVAALIKEGAPEGQRNNAVASFAGYLLSKKIPASIALDIVKIFNETRCVPPLTEMEVLATVRSIDRLAFANPTNTR